MATKKKNTKPKRRPPAKRKAPVADAMTSFLSQGREVTPTSITYILRCCSPQMEGHGGFKWPESGGVEAPDWDSRAECGNGLHGWLMGVGDVNVSTHWQDEGAKWLVCAVWSADVVDLCAKVKAPRAWVVFCGDAKQAGAEIVRLGANGAVIYGTATAGDAGTATAGYAGTATAGDAGTATAGYAGTATAGDAGTATAGDAGTATAGDAGTATAGYAGTATAGVRGTATAGFAGTATAGDAGTATAGYAGTATAGVRGTATAGDAGTATAGDAGTATAGVRGTATAGEDGVIVIKHWNDSRYKLRVANVGENGIEANVAYKLDADGAFVRAKP